MKLLEKVNMTTDMTAETFINDIPPEKLNSLLNDLEACGDALAFC